MPWSPSLWRLHNADLLGYKLEVVSLEGFDYVGAPAKTSSVGTNRAGRRFGSRSTKDLSPEELKELMKVG